MNTRRIGKPELMHAFCLGAAKIEPLLGRITTPSGEVRNLAKKPMDVLIHLAAADGGVIGRDDLVDAVWGPHSGGDEGLKRCIYAIRRALDDDPDAPIYIDTIHGRGYRCIAPISPPPATGRPGLAHANAAETASVRPPAASELAPEKRFASVVHGLITWHAEGAATMNAEALHVQWLALAEELQKAGQRFGESRFDARFGHAQWTFGVPLAHESSARAAVEAALFAAAVVRRFAESKTDKKAPRPIIRLGVSTGEVVYAVSDTGTRVSGVTLQQVEAMARVADPMSIWIDERTHALVKNYCIFADRTQRLQDDFPETTAFCVMATSEQKFDDGSHVASRHRTPLMGREHELEGLWRMWKNALQERGHIVVMAGEPGIGKTRLAREFIEMLRLRGCDAIDEYSCSPLYVNKAYHPITEFIRRECGLQEENDDLARLRRIELLLASLAVDMHICVPILANLLDVSVGQRYAPLAISGGRLKQVTVELLTQMVLQPWRREPALIVIEDLHWADPSSLELLCAITERGVTPNRMIVVTTRAEQRPDWTWRAHIAQLSLLPLMLHDAKRIVRHIAGAGTCEPEVARLTLQAGGNPLFLEEISRSFFAAQRSGQARAGSPIPDSLHQLLMARLDQLGEAKKTAQMAAVVGPSFDAELLHQLMPEQDACWIDEHLGALVRADVIYRTTSLPTPQFMFKHLLVHAAAYESIAGRRCKELHAAVAGALVRSNRADVPAELIAHHFCRAQRFMQSAAYWRDAATRSHCRSASQEAIRYLEHATADLQALPASVERDLLELSILVAAGPVRIARHGYSATEVERTYKRAEVLCDGLAGVQHLAPALFGLWAYKFVNGFVLTALETGQRLLQLAESTANEDLCLEANVLVGVTSVQLARYELGIRHLDAALSLYDVTKHAHHRFVYSQDPGMAAHIYRGLALLQQGIATEAFVSLRAGLELARRLDHPHSLAFAIALSARSYAAAGDWNTTYELAAEGLVLSQLHDFQIWLCVCEFIKAHAEFKRDGSLAALDDMGASLLRCRAIGNSLSALEFTGALAAALLDVNRIDEAEQLLSSARAELSRRQFSSDEHSIGIVEQRLQRMKARPTPPGTASARKIHADV